MKFIKVMFDEIVARLLMVVLAIMVLLLGLYSPDRLFYTLIRFGKEWKEYKNCNTC